MFLNSQWTLYLFFRKKSHLRVHFKFKTKQNVGRGFSECQTRRRVCQVNHSLSNLFSLPNLFFTSSLAFRASMASGDAKMKSKFFNQNLEDLPSRLVLEPDHPLMERFQSVLKKHLLRQLERLTSEVFELVSVKSRHGRFRRRHFHVSLSSKRTLRRKKRTRNRWDWRCTRRNRNWQGSRRNWRLPSKRLKNSSRKEKRWTRKSSPKSWSGRKKWRSLTQPRKKVFRFWELY